MPIGDGRKFDELCRHVSILNDEVSTIRNDIKWLKKITIGIFLSLVAIFLSRILI